MIRRMLLAVDESESSLHALRVLPPLVRSEEAGGGGGHGRAALPGGICACTARPGCWKPCAPPTSRPFVRPRRYPGPGTALEDPFEEGDPAETVLGLAEAGDFDLVVTSRKGRNILIDCPSAPCRPSWCAWPARRPDHPRRRRLGGCTRSCWPTTARPTPSWPPGGPSPWSAPYGARLILATVHELPVEGYAYWPEVFERLQEDGQRKLLEALAVRAKRGARRVETVFRLGRPADELCRLAEEEAVGLTVMWAPRA